ncbi:unnamed protein product [Ranitomeya imitator]|uniref:Uncharacterized protein n=1 Tax=Ranitomeya imitator TaxID=111125 RepID=A0ABN9LX48_9NEOB|nr:unnamed protein product [Ranitomeya imitator]
MWKRSSGSGTVERSVRPHSNTWSCTLRSAVPAPELRFHMRDTDVSLASENKPLRGDFVQKAFMAQIIRSKSTKCLSFPLTVTTLLTSTSWVLYGLQRRDPYIMVPPTSLGL